MSSKCFASVEAIVRSLPNAWAFSAGLSTRNSNAGIWCAKGTPLCPKRTHVAVPKKRRGLMSMTSSALSAVLRLLSREVRLT